MCLAPSCGIIIKLLCLLWFYSSPGYVLETSFIFRKITLQLKFMGLFSIAHRPWLDTVRGLLLLEFAHVSELRSMFKELAIEKGEVWLLHSRHWGWLWDWWQDYRVRVSHKLVDGLSAEILNKVIRNHILLILFDSLTYFFSDLLPSPSPFPQSWQSSLKFVLFCFLLQWHIGISSQQIWISTNYLLSLGACPSQHSSGFLWSWPRGVGVVHWSCWFHSLYYSLSAYYWCIGGWDSSQVPWHMVPDPRTPVETLLFMDGCLTSCLKGGTKRRNVLCHYDTSLYLLYSELSSVSYPYCDSLDPHCNSLE